MTTDQVPPVADEMPTVVPEKDEVPVDDQAVHADGTGYRQPEVDVDALRGLLDGRYRRLTGH